MRRRASFLSVKPALAFAKFGGNFPIDFSDDELRFDQKVVYWSRVCGVIAIAECVWALKSFYALMMENPDDLQMAKAIFSMHFIVAFLSLLYRLANTFSPNHCKFDLFKRIVQNMQQVQNCPFFVQQRRVQKNLRLVLFLAVLHLGYSTAAVVTDVEILNHGAVYATAKLLVSLVHQLMLVSEMVLYWAVALSTASQLDACGRNLRKRAVHGRAATHLRLCLWKMLQVIGDVDEAFGPMLLLVLTSRNIYIQMDVYNVLQNLIGYSAVAAGDVNELHAAAVCLLWTLLDLITIFMMLFPAILVLRKLAILIDEFSKLLNAKKLDLEAKMDIAQMMRDVRFHNSKITACAFFTLNIELISAASSSCIVNILLLLQST